VVEVEVRWKLGDVICSRVWQLPRVPVAGDLMLIEDTKTWLRVYEVLITPRVIVLAAIVLQWECLQTRFGMEVEVEST
jgi:hypothetical protein